MGFDRNVYTTFGWPPHHLGAADIMLPFYAYLLNGARFIAEPLLKYRVHSRNSSLSLIASRADPITQLRTEERIFHDHLAHAILMRDLIERLSDQRPERYRE